MAKRVSSIYGNALFELAAEENKMDALLSEVQTLQQILLENADLLSLLNHPEVSKIEKLDLLKNIFSGRASDEILGFLNIIVEKDRQKIEVTIPMKGNIIRSEQTSSDMYVSIDLVEEIIERQLRRYKTKLIAQQQAAASFQPDYLEADEEEEEEVKIVRTKKFDIKPMYPEDACVQMELLGHSFYVFCNAETDQVNVVYRRKGNTYGLIEPEV